MFVADWEGRENMYAMAFPSEGGMAGKGEHGAGSRDLPMSGANVATEFSMFSPVYAC